MPKPTLDEKIKKISIECQDDLNFIREIRKLKQAFREDLPPLKSYIYSEALNVDFNTEKTIIRKFTTWDKEKIEGYNQCLKELCERWK